MAEAPARKAAVTAPARKAAVTAPARKAAVTAPARKAAVTAPAKKAAVKALAKKAAVTVLATPNVTPEAANFTPDVEAVAERIKKTSERVLELSKENGLIWLAVFEKMLDGVLKLEEDAANDLGSDWVEKLVSTQADFIRDTSQAYLSALKDRLK